MDTCLVEKAKQNIYEATRLSESASLPDAGWRWQAYRTAALKWANYFRTPVEVIHAVQSPRSNMGYEARMTGRGLVEYVRSAEKNCQNLFPEYAEFLGSFIESPLSHPSTLTVMNGRLVSSPLYNHIFQIMRCSKFVRPRIVVEIGGGYGAPGRLWMTNKLSHPRIYIDVDFPESLYFAEVYLRANGQAVEYACSAGDVERAMSPGGEERKVLLVPIALIHALKDLRIDLLVNTGSLQEMSTEYVDFYMDWIESSQVDFFYSANYFGQKIDSLMEGMNYGAPFLGAGWKTLFRGLHEDASRPVAELLFQRNGEAHSADAFGGSARSLLQAGGPIRLPVFLELFDLARSVANPELLLDIVNRSMKMDYVPKEALLLANRALTLAHSTKPKNAQLVDRASRMVEHLTPMAAGGRSQMGIVDGTVARLREDLMSSQGEGIGFETKVSRLIETTQGTEIEIDGRVRHLRSGTFGSIERNEVNGNQVVISGWSLGASASDRVILVHYFLDGRVVDTVAPSIVRPEFDQGNKLIGFQFDVVLPVEVIQGMHFFVVSEFEDGTLGKLVNGGDI